MISSTGLLVLLGLVLLLVYHSAWILPGVWTLGVDLGGKSKAKAALALERDWQGRTVLLSAGETSWVVVPSTLGLALDVEATVEAAHRQGRAVDRIGALFRGEGEVTVPPVLEVDPAVAKANLHALRPQIDVPAVNAGVRLVEGRVEVLPPEPGRALDPEATVAWLGQNPTQVVTQGRLDLAISSVPPPVTDVSALVARANEWLAHTLSVYAYDPIANQTLAWTATSDVWGAWGTLSVDPIDPTDLSWQFDAEAAKAWVAAQAASLAPDRYLEGDGALAAIEAAIGGQGPRGRGGGDGSWVVRLRVYHRQRQHVVQPGETLSSIARDVGIPYPWIQQVNPGIGDALRVGQTLTLPSPDVLLPLPVVETKRIVVSLSQQRMWAYENGALLWEWPVSTGISSSPTAPGVFQIQSHEPNAYAGSWNLWMPYFMGIYRPVPTSDFMNGFHGFPTRDGASLLWTADLGHPVTYGCILVSTQNAAFLYEWAEEGVIVEIQR